MSSSADHRRDGGFSLVEVVVSLAIVGMLVAMTLPLLVTSIRSSDTARRALQEKGFAQTEVERMRNLPYHVAPAAGDFIDVFDRYYPNLKPASTPTCGTTGPYMSSGIGGTGYVAEGAKRCPWEPTKAFYRLVRTEATDPALKGFVVVVDTQFLSDATPPVPVTPASTYDTKVVGRSAPPTHQIGVAVSVFRVGVAIMNPLTTYTQIGRRDQLEPLVSASVDVKTLDLGTSTPEGIPFTVTAGLLGLDASLTNASRASAVASSVTTGISTGQQAAGASTSTTAPPSLSEPQRDLASGQLNANGCAIVCWGGTRSSGYDIAAAGGLPNVGTPAAPVRVTMRDLANKGLTLGTGAGTTLDNDLALARALVVLDEGGGSVDHRTPCGTGSGDNVRLTADGFIRTTAPTDATDPSRVEACGGARATRVSFLPTGFAPSGVVRLRLEQIAARCTVTGAGHTASTDVSYRARVEVWQGPNPNDYRTVADIDQATTTDLLAAVPMTTPVGGGHVLGDYIASWSSMTKNEVLRSTDSGTASVDVPGIVDIVTQPVRRYADTGEPEPISSISLTLGVASCEAVDRR